MSSSIVKSPRYVIRQSRRQWLPIETSVLQIPDFPASVLIRPVILDDAVTTIEY